MAKPLQLYIMANDKQLKGPFTRQQIYQFFVAQQINLDTLITAAFVGDAPNPRALVKLKKSNVYARFEHIRTEHIVLTTETSFPPGVIAKRLEIISAECAFGMNIFADLATSFSDFFGGRSKTTQNALKEAREAALGELRVEADDVGADAVVGVDLDYSEFSGWGKSMLFIVASGTAVKLAAPL